MELACAQPIGRVRVAWNATLGLSFIIVICAIAAAAANDADPRGNKGAGFAGVWCIFVLFLVGINGACTDRTAMSSIAHRARGAARARDVSDDSRRPRPAAAPGPSAYLGPSRFPRLHSSSQNALGAHGRRADGQRRHDVPAVLQ